jgi:hypothetical protein
MVKQGVVSAGLKGIGCTVIPPERSCIASSDGLSVSGYPGAMRREDCGAFIFWIVPCSIPLLSFGRGGEPHHLWRIECYLS